MKKKLITSMLIGATIASLLSGCGSKNNATDKETTKETTTEITTTEIATEEVKPSHKEVSYELVYNGATFKLDENIEDVVAKLGKQIRPSSVVSQCGFPGSVTGYYYDGMEVWESRNIVVEIQIKKDTVATAEGIKVGMTKADVINTYGEPDRPDLEDPVYSNGVYHISFRLEGDVITGIHVDLESDEIIKRGYSVND